MENLTHRQASFVKGVLQGRSYARAAREAGYSESVANCAGRKIASKPEVQGALKAAEEKEPRLTASDKELLANFNKLPHWPRSFIGRMIASLAVGDWQGGLGLIDVLGMIYRPKVK
jgi:hypothetical protein